MIEALAEPSYADAVAQINAASRLKAMQATNEAFKAAVTHKIEFLSREKVPTIAECKRSLNKYLKPLLDYLELMSELKPKIYRASTAKILEEIEYVLTAAKLRRNRKGNHQSEDELIDAA